MPRVGAEVVGERLAVAGRSRSRAMTRSISATIRRTSAWPTSWISSGVRSVVVWCRTRSAYHSRPVGQVGRGRWSRGTRGGRCRSPSRGSAGTPGRTPRRRRRPPPPGRRRARRRRRARSGLVAGSASRWAASCSGTWRRQTAGGVTPRARPRCSSSMVWSTRSGTPRRRPSRSSLLLRRVPSHDPEVEGRVEVRALHLVEREVGGGEARPPRPRPPRRRRNISRLRRSTSPSPPGRSPAPRPATARPRARRRSTASTDWSVHRSWPSGQPVMVASSGNSAISDAQWRSKRSCSVSHVGGPFRDRPGREAARGASRCSRGSGG